MRWLRRLIDTILRGFGFGGGAVPREPVTLRPIAVVRNNVFEPRVDGWEAARLGLGKSRIQLDLPPLLLFFFH